MWGREMSEPLMRECKTAGLNIRTVKLCLFYNIANFLVGHIN